MNFGDVFSKAWNTVWKNKVLWIFGFFASLIAYNGNGNNGDGGGITWRESFNYTPGNMPRWFYNFGNDLESMFDRVSTGEWIALGLGLVIIGILFFLVKLFLGHVGRGAVIRGAVMADDGQKLKFGQLFNQGLHYFWKLLGLWALIVVAVIVVVIAAILLSLVTLGVGAILLLCLSLPILIGFSLWIMQTNIFIVVEDEDIFTAIGHAWNWVFEQHLGNYLLMGLLLVVGSILAGLVIALPALILGIPTALALFSGNGIAPLGIVMAIVAIVIYLPIYIVLQGLKTSFVWSAWVYFYQDLLGGDAAAEEELEQLALEGGMPGDGEMV
jgi:hypothetical protein